MPKLIVLCAFFYAVAALEQLEDPSKQKDTFDVKSNTPFAQLPSRFPYQKSAFVDPHYGAYPYQYQQGHLGYPYSAGYTEYPYPSYQQGVYNTPYQQFGFAYPYLSGYTGYNPISSSWTAGVHTPYTIPQHGYYPGAFDYNRPTAFGRSIEAPKA